MITQNHGRLGGTLDNTKYLEAGARSTCNASELRAVGLDPGTRTDHYGFSGLVGGEPAPMDSEQQ